MLTVTEQQAAFTDERASLDVLAAEISTQAAHISALTCRWLGLVAEFDRREGWAHWGMGSCADWMAWQCSMSPCAARDHVRVARRLEDLPLIREAYARGELSYSKVRALARIDRVAHEAEILELARHATAAQLDRMVGAFREVTSAEAHTAHTTRFLSIQYDDDGSALIRGRIPVEAAAVLERALEGAEERTYARQEAPEVRPSDTWGARRADALIWLAETAMAAGDVTRTGGDRTQIVVHVDVQALSETPDAPAHPRCELAEGTPLAAETARRLCCDAAIVTALEKDGSTLSVGRSTRSIPPSIRRALRSRQPECQFPGCTRTKWLDAHHIKHWAHGGHTSLDNLVHLCHHHHQLLHEGGYTLAGRGADGTLDVRTDTGRRVEAASIPRRGDCACVLADHGKRGITPDRDTIGQLSYSPMNLGRCVDALLQWTDQGDPPGS